MYCHAHIYTRRAYSIHTKQEVNENGGLIYHISCGFGEKTIESRKRVTEVMNDSIGLLLRSQRSLSLYIAPCPFINVAIHRLISGRSKLLNAPTYINILASERTNEKEKENMITLGAL